VQLNSKDREEEAVAKFSYCFIFVLQILDTEENQEYISHGSRTAIETRSLYLTDTANVVRPCPCVPPLLLAPAVCTFPFVYLTSSLSRFSSDHYFHSSKSWQFPQALLAASFSTCPCVPLIVASQSSGSALSQLQSLKTLQVSSVSSKRFSYRFVVKKCIDFSGRSTYICAWKVRLKRPKYTYLCTER
jgi:hypothetical protein